MPISDILHLLLLVSLIVIGYYVILWVSLIIHETGHFLAGRLMGFPILEVQLGVGSRWRTIHLAGVPWHLHTQPVRGWVAPKEKDFLDERRRGTVFVLGGPIATILLALCVHFGFGIHFANPFGSIDGFLKSFQFAGLKSPTWEYVGMATSFVILSAWSSLWLTALACLFPYRSFDRSIENDGFLLLKIFFDRYRDPRDPADRWKVSRSE